MVPHLLALVAELADAPDSKSGSSECGFESHRAHVPVMAVVPYPFFGKIFGAWVPVFHTPVISIVGWL